MMCTKLLWAFLLSFSILFAIGYCKFVSESISTVNGTYNFVEYEIKTDNQNKTYIGIWGFRENTWIITAKINRIAISSFYETAKIILPQINKTGYGPPMVDCWLGDTFSFNGWANNMTWTLWYGQVYGLFPFAECPVFQEKFVEMLPLNEAIQAYHLEQKIQLESRSCKSGLCVFIGLCLEGLFFGGVFLVLLVCFYVCSKRETDPACFYPTHKLKRSL